MLGKRRGGFAFSGARTIVGIPDGVSILDANSDGKPDAVTHHSTTIVTLCFGDGAGGFASSSDTNTGVASYFVPVGDMNGDSLLDVVVSGIGAHVWLSNGAGSLAQAGGFNAISFGPPLLADLDGDADLDLAATDYATDRLLIASGDGAGGLASPLSVVTGHGPTGSRSAIPTKTGASTPSPRPRGATATGMSSSSTRTRARSRGSPTMAPGCRGASGRTRSA